MPQRLGKKAYSLLKPASLKGSKITLTVQRKKGSKWLKLKSVARKIAATFASTGSPAFFVHPGEASHGDLGMLAGGDVVLAISNSGESDELAAILPAMKRLGVTLVAMTGRAVGRRSGLDGKRGRGFSGIGQRRRRQSAARS